MEVSSLMPAFGVPSFQEKNLTHYLGYRIPFLHIQYVCKATARKLTYV